MVKICAEYVWCDVNGLYRSKTKIIELKGLDSRLDVTTYPKWNYDGSSTQDAMNMEFNEITECQLYPISIYPDPFRDSDTDVIVWCYNTFLKPDIDKYESIMNNKSSNNNSNNNSNNDSNSESNSESNNDSNSESNNDSNSESNNDSNSYLNNDYNNNESDSDSATVENINFHKEKNHNYNRIQKRFELGLSQLNDLDYIKVMTEYPINTNMKYAIKCFDTIFKKHEPMFGFEQEFFFYDTQRNLPLGMKKDEKHNIVGYSGPQGPYYCGVGAGKVFGRYIAEKTMDNLLYCGLNITGMNFEVAPGQCEFQLCEKGIKAADDLMILRYILVRTGEEFNISINFYPKPVLGNWNGSGCHTNYSTKTMREENGLIEIMNAIKKLEKTHKEHIEVYGDNNHLRLTGKHETASINKFSYGIADRGSSIRIPRFTDRDKKGYMEDRRPASNMNPYKVISKIAETTILN